MEKFREKEGITLHSLGYWTIIRYNNIVVKASSNLHSHEAATLQFIATAIMILILRVYNVYYNGDRVIAIIIDYILGKMLEEAWDDLNSY